MAKQTSGEGYQTFSSGDGPVIPSDAKKDFAEKDGPSGLSSYTSNSVDDEQGSVPEVPSVKR